MHAVRPRWIVASMLTMLASVAGAHANKPSAPKLPLVRSANAELRLKALKDAGATEVYVPQAIPQPWRVFSLADVHDAHRLVIPDPVWRVELKNGEALESKEPLAFGGPQQQGRRFTELKVGWDRRPDPTLLAQNRIA